MSNNNIDPTTGRCTRHPGIQLLTNRNNDGEWRTLMKACPLCVSGLPPTIVASAVAEAAAAEATRNNQNELMGTYNYSDHDDEEEDDELNTTRDEDDYNNDLDAKIALKRQQMKHKKKHKKKKKKHSSDNNNRHSPPSKNRDETAQVYEKSPRSRPRSPSPQSPYIPRRQHVNIAHTYDYQDDDVDDNNNDYTVNNDSAAPRKLFDHNEASLSSTPRLPLSSPPNSDAGDFVDRMNGNTFRQFIERDKQQQQQQYQMGQGGERTGGNDPPPKGYYDNSNDNFVRGGQQQQRQQRHHHQQQQQQPHYTSSASVRSSGRHQSDVSSQGSHYSSAAERAASRSRSRQRGLSPGSSHYSSSVVSVGTHYSSTAAQRRHVGEAVSDDDDDDDSQGSYSSSSSSSDEESSDDENETESYAGSYLSNRDEQSIGSRSHHSRQQQHYQHHSTRHRTPPPSQNSVRPDPEAEDYPNQTPQMSSAERMMRHRQYNTSQSTPQQKQFDDSSQEEEDDSDNSNEDENEREVLEPEEVSIISMNSSASRNLLRAKLQEERRAILNKQEQGSQIIDPDDRPIKMCDYDQKGRCVRHPHIRLRKKKMIKGWVTLLSNCPECCLDEMKRVKKKYQERESSSPVGEDGSILSNSVSSSKKKKKKKKNKKPSSQLPPITQLNVANSRGSSVDDSSSGTASTFTFASSSNTSGRWQNYLTSNASVASAPSTTARVTRLPYNDQHHGNGWYTGQVSMAGIPNGWGMMNYANGHTFEGEWRNGVSLVKTKEAPPVLGRGGGGDNFYSPSHQHHPSHQVYSSPHEQRRGGSGIDPPESRRQMTQLETLRENPSPSIRSRNRADQRSRIVSNMPYRDNRGFVIGAYTGEVDEYRVPNGIGKMRYNDGLVSEGRWVDGELEDGYNVTDDEGGDDDASYRSSSGRSAHSRNHHDGYQNSNTSSYPGENLQSKLSTLETRISAMGLNNSQDWS